MIEAFVTVQRYSRVLRLRKSIGNIQSKAFPSVIVIDDEIIKFQKDKIHSKNLCILLFEKVQYEKTCEINLDLFRQVFVELSIYT